MKTAFKEWAVIVEALGMGEQIIILRKGGISEGKGGFRVEHPDFLFFPTAYHQQNASVTQKALDIISSRVVPVADDTRIPFTLTGKVVDWRELHNLDMALKLQNQHVWKEDVIRQRYEWGRTQHIFAMAVRVYRLPKPALIDMKPSYEGCKSWIELEQDVSIDKAVPVLDDDRFEKKLAEFREALH